MKYFPANLLIKSFVFTASALLLAACGDAPREAATLSALEEDGVLKVATRNGSTTYYLNRHEQPIGPEYDLVSAFARDNDWEVEWLMLDSTADVLQALEQGTVHIAAAGLTHRPTRDERFTKGPAHTEITQQLVCNRELRPIPRSAADLPRLNTHVTAGSSYAETLKTLREADSSINFTESTRHSTEILLSQVANGRIDCTVADSNIVQVTRRYWPALEIIADLSEGQNLGWYLPQGNADLAATAKGWMNSGAGNTAIAAMETRYYAYISDFDFVDLRALNRRLSDRLPNFRRHFTRAEENTGMPAELLAALAYQESHWDPEARSATGVRGLMMLTQRTAESLGVDRLDPPQAIEGGARYLADLHARLPDTIPEPDRTYLALASYNIGRGHLLDARQMARNMGKNPDSWEDMQEVLPLKADPRYYPQTRYGYARGYEPVHYVQRIRNYQDVIATGFE